MTYALRDGAAPSAVAATVQTTTAEVIRRSRDLHFDDLPSDVVQLAKCCLLDWHGVALAGSREPAATVLRAAVLAEGGPPQATLVGTGELVGRTQAALVNGTAAHALDFDDVHAAVSGHPSVPVLSALLALAEPAGMDGRSFLSAFVAGFEAECRIGRLVNPSHYAAGFHATGTIGTFGAAAACAHALDLDDQQWQMTLGLAAAQAAGLKSMFGTMAKPLQAGRAASNGLLAAILATRGFTAVAEVLDVDQGFTATMCPQPDQTAARSISPGNYDLADVRFKVHAACYLTHPSIDAIQRLLRRHGFTAADVATVELLVPPGHLSVCNIPAPATALEAKFSLRFTTALALAGAGTNEQAFTQANVLDARITALRDRVTVTADITETDAHATSVVVGLFDGRMLRERVSLTTSCSASDQWNELEDKFHSLADPVLGPSRSRALRAAISQLHDATSLAGLIALTVPDKPGMGEA